MNYVMTTILLMPNIFFLYRIVDIVDSQIKNKFEGMLKIANLFEYLRPKPLLTLSEKEILKSATELKIHFCNDLSENFPMQLNNAVYFLTNDNYTTTQEIQLGQLYRK